MTTQTAPAAKTVTLTYAVVTAEERSVEAPPTCPGEECGADLTAEKAITETWLVHCDFGGSFVVDQAEKPTYRNGYVYSMYRSGFATVDFRCARCNTSLLP
jgi:hypothetical protein